MWPRCLLSIKQCSVGNVLVSYRCSRFIRISCVSRCIKHWVKNNKPKEKQKDANNKARENWQKFIRAVSFHVGASEDGRVAKGSSCQEITPTYPPNCFEKVQSKPSRNLTVKENIPNSGNVGEEAWAAFHQHRHVYQVRDPSANRAVTTT